MKLITLKASAVSTLALTLSMPVWAQSDVQVLSTWNYDQLYSEGWSVEDMFDETEVIGTTGEDIGDVENVLFSNEGKVLGIIAEVGGLWDLGDTHVHVPWADVSMPTGMEQVQVPVTEETVDDYDVFGDGWFDEQVLTDADTETTQAVDDDLVAGEGVFKATDLIGDYIYLADGARYGYVADIIVQDGQISAIVTDAGAYGRRGYYAYPYSYRGDMTRPRYELPYQPTEIDSIEAFDYEQLQSRVSQ